MTQQATKKAKETRAREKGRCEIGHEKQQKKVDEEELEWGVSCKHETKREVQKKVVVHIVHAQHVEYTQPVSPVLTREVCASQKRKMNPRHGLHRTVLNRASALSAVCSIGER